MVHLGATNHNLWHGFPSESKVDRTGAPFMTTGTGSQSPYSKETPIENSWGQFFGIPDNYVAPKKVELAFDVENERLPDAYKNTSINFVTEKIIRRISMEERFGTSKMFPLFQYEGSQNVSWDQVIFNDTVLDRVPEEGVPRMLSYRRTTDSATIARYAKSFHMEHGFMRSPLGKMVYISHLEQMANAIIETAELGCIIAALNYPLYEDPNDIYRNQSEHGIQQLGKLFENEIQDWARIQKEAHGLHNMLEKGRTALKKRINEPGNIWVLPQGVMQYVKSENLKKAFYITGHRFGEGYERYIQEEMGGVMYFESRDYYIGDNYENTDPTTVNRTIGTFFTMDDRVAKMEDAENFRASHENICIYDESSRSVELLQKNRCAKYGGLFDTFEGEDYAPRSAIGDAFFANYDSWGAFMHAADGLDYFVRSLHSKPNEVIQHFIDHVYHEVDKPASRSSSRNIRDDDGIRRMGPAERRRQFASGARFNGGGVSTARAVPEDEEETRPKVTDQEALEVIMDRFPDMRSTSEKQSQAEQVVRTLKDLDSRYDDALLPRYVTGLKNGKSTLNSVLNDAWATLGSDLLELDSRVSAAKSVSQYKRQGYQLTEVEEEGRRVCSASGDCDENKFSKLRKLDARSIKWLSQGEQTPTIQQVKLYTNPALIRSTASKVAFKSDLFSLTTNNLVLFAIDEGQYQYALQNNGAVHLERPDGSNLEHDTTRSALFQYSAALSLVGNLVIKSARKMREQEQKTATKFKEMIQEAGEAVRTLVNPNLTDTRDPDDMIRAAKTADSLPVLHCQAFARPLIFALRDLLRIVYDPTSTKEQLLNQLNTAILEVHQSRYEFSPNSRGTAGGFFPHFLDTDEHALMSVNARASRPKGADEKEEKYEPLPPISRSEAMKLQGDAVKAVADLHKTQDKDRIGTLADSFLVLNKRYEALYIACRRAGIKPDVWKNWVSIADRIYANKLTAPAPGGGAGRIALVDATGGNISSKAAVFISVLMSELSLRGPSGDNIDGWAWKEIKKGDEDAAVYTMLSARQAEGLDELASIAKISNAALPKFDSDAKKKNMTRAEIGKVVSRLAEIYDPRLAYKEYLQYCKNGFEGFTDDTRFALFKIFHDNLVNARVAIKKGERLVGVHQELYGYYVRGLPPSSEVINLSIKDETKKIFQQKESASSRRPLVSSHAATSSDEKGQEPGLDDEKSLFVQAVQTIASGGKEKKIVSPAQIRAMVMKMEIKNSAFPVWCASNDVYVPIGYIGFRPHAEYLMSTAIHMQGGPNGAGKTLWAWPDFQLADNVAQKMTYGHMSMYIKTIIFHKEKLLHMRNCFCQDYVRGNSISFFDHLNKYDRARYKEDNIEHDIFLIPIPANWRAPAHFLDICGTWHKALGANKQSQEATNYPNSKVFSSLWGWRHRVNPLDRTFDREQKIPMANTICFRDNQWNYNPKSGKYDHVVEGKGHWQTMRLGNTFGPSLTDMTGVTYTHAV